MILLATGRWKADFCLSPKHTDIGGKFGTWCKVFSCASDIKANRTHKENKITLFSLAKKLNTDHNLLKEFKVNYFFRWNKWEGLSISVHKTCCTLRRVTLSGLFITICFSWLLGFLLSLTDDESHINTRFGFFPKVIPLLSITG